MQQHMVKHDAARLEREYLLLEAREPNRNVGPQYVDPGIPEGLGVMLMKVAINGSRTPQENPSIPVTPEQQAAKSSAAAQLHVYTAEGLKHGHVEIL